MKKNAVASLVLVFGAWACGPRSDATTQAPVTLEQLGERIQAGYLRDYDRDGDGQLAQAEVRGDLAAALQGAPINPDMDGDGVLNGEEVSTVAALRAVAIAASCDADRNAEFAGAELRCVENSL